MTDETTAAAGAGDLIALIEAAERIVFFTGAGISTESGIPDYRGPNGLWSRMQPIYFDDFVASEESRLEDWRRRFKSLAAFGEAKPNSGHRAIAGLVNAGKASHVITQNIDGLHQRAGTPAEAIIEIHGNGTFATCLECGRRYEFDWVKDVLDRTGASPRCEACGGLVKAAVISFGQAMPADEMERAQDASLKADLYVVVGSSLVVYPAARLPAVAKSGGARLVIVNRDPTDLDPIADLVVRGEVGEAFHPLVDQNH